MADGNSVTELRAAGAVYWLCGKKGGTTIPFIQPRPFHRGRGFYMQKGVTKMSDMVKITFPDGAVKEFAKGTTTEDIAASISPGLKKKSLAGKLNGKEIDLRTPINEDGTVEIITEGSEEGLQIMRHSAAHLLAQAIKRIYKDVKFGVGPVIENGFYYDVEMDEAITPEDLPKIEKEMKKSLMRTFRSFEKKSAVKKRKPVLRKSATT